MTHRLPNDLSRTELGYLSGISSDVQTQLNAKLNLSGGSLTGNLDITKATAYMQIKSSSGSANLYIDGPSATERLVRFRGGTNNSRWHIGANSTAESGSNAGTNFIIQAYDDSATLLSTPVTITRSTGAVALSGALSVTGKVTTAASSSGDAGLSLPHGTAPSSPTNGDVWTTTAGIYVRVNGSTVGPLGTGGGGGSAVDDASAIIAGQVFG